MDKYKFNEVVSNVTAYANCIGYIKEIANSVWERNTYRTPEHRVQTNDPMVMLTYVGPRWSQSKHCLLPCVDASSRKSFRFLSSCFFRTTAILSTVRFTLLLSSLLSLSCLPINAFAIPLALLCSLSPLLLYTKIKLGVCYRCVKFLCLLL